MLQGTIEERVDAALEEETALISGLTASLHIKVFPEDEALARVCLAFVCAMYELVRVIKDEAIIKGALARGFKQAECLGEDW